MWGSRSLHPRKTGVPSRPAFASRGVPSGPISPPESARVLEDAGADVDLRIYEGMGHTVNRDEIDAVQGMIDVLAGERRA